MSDSFNPLNPRNDLSCPNLNRCINQVFGPPIATEKQAEAASEELSRLLEIIKAQREQMERTDKALTNISIHVAKQSDILCNIRDTLKAAMQDTGSFASDRRQEAIKAVLKKNFSLDLDA